MIGLIDLIHRVAVDRADGNILDRIPVFDYFAVLIEPKKIHCDVLVITGPNLVRVQSHQIAFGHCSHEVDGFVGIFRRHPFKIRDEARPAVGYQGIMLDVFITDIELHSPPGITLVGHSVKGDGALLVLGGVH